MLFLWFNRIEIRQKKIRVHWKKRGHLHIIVHKSLVWWGSLFTYRSSFSVDAGFVRIVCWSSISTTHCVFSSSSVRELRIKTHNSKHIVKRKREKSELLVIVLIALIKIEDEKKKKQNKCKNIQNENKIGKLARLVYQ